MSCPLLDCLCFWRRARADSEPLTQPLIKGKAPARCSARDFVRRSVILCKIGKGAFGVVSVVLDKDELQGLLASPEAAETPGSALAAMFAVKRISRAADARIGGGGARAERHSLEGLVHPFIPLLHAAARSSTDFYIASPFALGGDVGRALVRRARSVEEAFARQQNAAGNGAAATSGGSPFCGEPPGSSSGVMSSPTRKDQASAQASARTMSGTDLILDELALDDDSFFGGGANGHSVNKDGSSALFRHGTSGAAHAAVLRRVPSSSSSINQHASASGFQLDGTRAAALGLPIRFVALVAFELLSALRCLNDNGFSHYDVRPSNILIESGGHVVLGDFGTVRREVLMADALAPLPGGSFAGSPSGVLDTAGAREQRLQHYLPPEHLTAAGRVAAENDGCRLSDVWSFAVVLCELATGVHPFTPPNSPSPAPAHLVLQNIARLKYQPVRAEHLLPSSDESVTVRLLNDLVAECFVARAARKSADELVQLPFFSSDAVRRCAGAPPASWALPTPKFFASVVDARLLQPSPSLHPMAMCHLGGAPSAADMWEMLPIVAAAPHDVSADNFADSVDPDALVDMDTREVLDLRFFAAPTEEALSAWTEADNAAAVQDQDSQWAPDGMTARRADHHHRLRDDVRALGIAGESKMAFTYVRNRH